MDDNVMTDKTKKRKWLIRAAADEGASVAAAHGPHQVRRQKTHAVVEGRKVIGDLLLLVYSGRWICRLHRCRICGLRVLLRGLVEMGQVPHLLLASRLKHWVYKL